MRFLRQALIGLVLMSMALGLLGYAGYLGYETYKEVNRVKRGFPSPRTCVYRQRAGRRAANHHTVFNRIW